MRSNSKASVFLISETMNTKDRNRNQASLLATLKNDFKFDENLVILK